MCLEAQDTLGPDNRGVDRSGGKLQAIAGPHGETLVGFREYEFDAASDDIDDLVVRV